MRPVAVLPWLPKASTLLRSPTAPTIPRTHKLSFFQPLNVHFQFTSFHFTDEIPLWSYIMRIIISHILGVFELSRRVIALESVWGWLISKPRPISPVSRTVSSCFYPIFLNNLWGIWFGPGFCLIMLNTSSNYSTNSVFRARFVL